ncbi:MAG TPA: hypothetical protein VGM73_17565, partial [Candidatus Didemnitutus sp.]
TATGELHATDFMRRSWLSDLLGRHIFTALYSNETYSQKQQNYDLYAMGGAWDEALGTGTNPDGSGIAPLSASTREISWLNYDGPPLFNASSPHGLNLAPMTSVINPTGSITAQYFDSHWTPSTNPADPAYVDPAAPWTNPVPNGTSTPTVSTQSENPANYVGWKTGTFPILNADTGDINSLYRQAAKLKQGVSSEGFTWQANLWNDMVAATYGWRRDVQTQRSGSGSVDPLTGSVGLNFDLAPDETQSRGISRSWGVVVHEPEAWRRKLPWDTNLSVTYDHGENTRVENRYGFDGDPLPNAQGSTNDYGFTISTLRDRLQFKVTWYKTVVKNANLSSVLSSESTLGSNAYYQWLLPPWGLGDVLQAVAGMAGDHAADGSAYNWNWAASAHPNEPAYADVTSSAFLNDPQTIKEKAAIASFLGTMDQYFPQSWWDKFGYPVNVAEAKLGHYQTAVTGWNVSEGNYAINSTTGGTVNGVPPVGTVDYVSKGIEFEVVGQVTKNWNVEVNASKQNAYQSALGQQLVDFITKEEEFYSSPAGDIRLWYGGDQGIGAYFEQNVGAAFRFQQQTDGKLTPEMSPWRFNAVSTYRMDHGPLRGAFVGGGYRWEQGHILGYALNDTMDNLDVNKPYWSRSQSHTDLWVGYERKIMRGIDWRVQLNLRSVGEHPRLDPLSVQPDGTPALYRIEDGTTWSLTNTFTF